MNRTWLLRMAALLIAFWLLLPPGTALAQDAAGGNASPLVLDAARCLGDTCEPGWLPIRVRVDNPSDRDVRARVLVTYLNLGSDPVCQVFADENFARHSKRDLYYTLFVPPLNSMEGAVEVRIQPEASKQDAWVLLKFRVVFGPRYLSLSRTQGLMSDLPLSEEEGGGSQSSYPMRDVQVAEDLRKDALPESWAGYERAVMILLNDVSVQELTELQRNALVDWVRAGGTLLVSPGPDPLWLENEVLSRVAALPAPRVELVKKLGSLEQEFGELAAREPFSYYRWEGGRRLLGTAQEPLLTAFPAGLGNVYLLGMDLGRAPFTAWSNRHAFWKAIVQRVPAPPTREEWRTLIYSQMGVASEQSLDERIEPISIGLSSLPSVLLLLLVIGLYLVVIGPVNYLVLRRLNLQIYTVVTVPLIAFAFVLLIILLGYATRGVSSRHQRGSLSVVPAGDSRAFQTGYLGTLAASARGFDFDFGVGQAAHPLYVSREIAAAMQLRYEAGPATRLSGYPLKLWETGFFLSRGWVELGGPLKAVAHDGRVTVTNGTGRAIRSAVLIGRDGMAFGDTVPIPVGAEVDLVSTRGQKPDGNARVKVVEEALGLSADKFRAAFAELIRKQIPHVTRPGAANDQMVLGWFEQDPGSLQVDGASPRLSGDLPLFVLEIESAAK